MTRPRFPWSVVARAIALLFLCGGPGAADDKPTIKKETPERLDKRGDPLPRGALARIGTLRFRHTGLGPISFSPNGKVLASGGGDGKIRFWDPATGKEVKCIAVHWKSIHTMAFSRDGTVLASGGQEGEVILLQMATGKELGGLTCGNPVLCLAFSPDGTLIATGEQSSNTVRVWDAATGRQIQCFQGKRGYDVSSVAFSPDGKTLAAVCDRQNINLWDVSTWQARGALEGHKEPITALVFAPDDKMLFSGSFDTTVRFWDLAERRERRCLGSAKENVSGQGPLIQSLAVAPDSKSLAAGRQDGSISVWDTATGKELLRWPADRGAIRSLSFSPDGKTLASASSCHRIRLWDSRTGKRLDPYTEPIARPQTIRFSPDGTFLAVDDDGQTLRLFDTSNRKERVSVEMPFMSLSSFAISPDSRTVVFAERTFAALLGIYRIRLLDAPTGKVKTAFEELTGVRGTVAFWPQEDVVTARCFDELLSWDPTTGKVLKRWKIPGGRTSELAFSPDRRILARDGEEVTNFVYAVNLSLWDLSTGKKLRSFGEGQESYRSLLVFSPDGKTLASARGRAVDREPSDVILWEVATGKERCRLKQNGREITSVAFSPDGALTATAEPGRSIRPVETIRVWDAATGEEVGRLSGHVSTVEALAFSPDSKVLASGSCDSTILFWDPWAVIPERKPPPDKLGKDRLSAIWGDLKDEDGIRAYRAIDTLARNPNEAVPFLRQLLPLEPAPDAQVIARLIADLDDDNFATREQASADLARAGPSVGPALRKALTGKTSAEARRRLMELVAPLDEQMNGPDGIRTLRAIETLERIGTAEARKVFQELQAGADSSAAEDAKASLERLARRSAPPVGAGGKK